MDQEIISFLTLLLSFCPNFYFSSPGSMQGILGALSTIVLPLDAWNEFSGEIAKLARRIERAREQPIHQNLRTFAWLPPLRNFFQCQCDPSTLGHLQEKRKANESNNLDKSFKKTIKIMQIPIALLIIPPQFPILRGYSNQNNPTNTSEQSDRGWTNKIPRENQSNSPCCPSILTLNRFPQLLIVPPNPYPSADLR
jgi:hypothetical protein